MKIEDYNKYYIQGSDHYLIPKDVFKELFNEMVNWKEESKGLNQKYLNAVADYETTMFEKEQLNSLVNSCQEEIRELKKQLEEKDILIKQCELSVSNVMDCYCERTDCSERIKDSKQYDSLVQKVENQQKEFIKWLENGIEKVKNTEFLDERIQRVELIAYNRVLCL